MIITQLPELYLRGSLANETMTNLTSDEIEKASYLTEYVANHDVLQKHKRRYIRDLSITIGGDYRDAESAEQDYYVTIWRGVVILYFHKKYEFECTKCGARTYRNQSGTMSEIRNRTETCPACNSCGENGESPIKVLIVGHAHPDPDSVINDETQLCRWFSRQLTNAVRQQLRENPIITTTRTNLVTDYADKQIIRSIQALLNSAKISHQLVSTDQGSDTQHAIYFDILSSTSRVIGQLSVIRQEAQDSGVIMTLDSTGIQIKRGLDCKNTTQTVTEKVHVTMLTPSQGHNDAPNPIEVPAENEIDHVSAIISNDLMEVIDSRLPTEKCRAYVQVRRQQGPYFDQYCEKFGTDQYYSKNIEAMLDLNKKEVHTLRLQVAAIALELLGD